jgi:cyclophilin family peptidyl-prolyl cis-trans isomerase
MRKSLYLLVPKILILQLFFQVISCGVFAQKDIYILQKEVVDSRGNALLNALNSKSSKIQLEACHLAATWAEEAHLDQLHQLIQSKNCKREVLNAALFAIGQIGSMSSVKPIQDFIQMDQQFQCGEAALLALAKCINPYQELPLLWKEDEQVTTQKLNAMSQALVFAKCNPQNWFVDIVRVSPVAAMNEKSRLFLAVAIGKSTFKSIRQQNDFVFWLREWYASEQNLQVRVKLHRPIALCGQGHLLVKDLLNKSERLSFSACAQLTQLDSSSVFQWLPLNWTTQCENSFAKAWMEIQFNQINFDQIRTILNQENWTIDEKVILTKAWNKNGHLDAQNAILFHFFETENTIERMQWVRCMTNSYHLLDSLILSLETFEPAVQYAIAETALGTGEYLNTPGQYSFEENILLHAKDFGVQSLVADFIHSNPSQFVRNQELIDLFNNQLSHLTGDETIETRIAIIQALGSIDPEHVYVKPSAMAQPFPSYQTWRRNKVSTLRIHTDQGKMVLRLDGKRCPMSVANIKQLAQQGYFENIAFHRVIPEFVAQAGCTRGDGMSGMSSVIYSELSNRSFDSNTIGMASAGKHTESAQFFITLSATPHLNGRYTQFGELTRGNKTLKKIHLGTKIKKVK